MTEQSFQECRKIMQRANLLRGLITKAEGNVAKWTKIEGSHREHLRESQANGAAKLTEGAIKKLQELRQKFSDLNFPDSNIVEEINRCKECGRRIAVGNDYCGECLCEDDSDF